MPITTYDDYMKSQMWLEKRALVLDFWGRACCICGRTYTLEVHHRTYERLGEELITDLIVLCEECHERNSKFVNWPRQRLPWLEMAMRMCDAKI